MRFLYSRTFVFILFAFLLIPISIILIINQQSQQTKRNAQAAILSNGPDLDVLYIERTPMYDYDAAKGWPAPGDTVTFIAHVKNSGTTATGNFNYQWSLDGNVVNGGTGANLNPQQQTTFTQTWIWQNGNHTIKFQADPNNVITEMSEQNNTVEDRTNALSVGFWVEQSLYNWFNANQYKLGLGSNSWEDWAQRQITEWNRIYAASTYPSNPQGILDRERLAKVIVVPDGSLPSKEHPSPDKTVDQEWGMQSSGLNSGFYDINGQPKLNIDLNAPVDTNPFYLEHGIMHELSHARYLADLYAFDINRSGSDEAKVLRQDGTQVVPKGSVINFHCDGGMMGCISTSDRSHIYSEEDVFAFNAKAGQRAKCGNFNPPCDVGSFLRDIPMNNYFKFTDIYNNPIVNATVYVYQSVSTFTTTQAIYDKIIDNTPDITCTTDANGICNIGSNPFGTLVPGYIDFWPQGVDVIKIVKNTQETFRYFFIPQANLNYWKNGAEGQESGVYKFTNIDFRDFNPTNQALHKQTSTNVTSGIYPGHDPSQAVDGDTTTPDNGFNVNPIKTGGWWQVDLGSQMNIGKVVIYPSATFYGWFCSAYHISISQTGSFTGEDIRVVDNNSPNDGTENKKIYSFPNITGRYVRITCDQPDLFYLQEFEVYALAGSPPIQTTPTPIQTITPIMTGSAGSTGFSITVCPHGTGSCGDNVNPTSTGNTTPKHQQRTTTMTLLNAQNQIVATSSGTVTYNTTAGNFQGTIPFTNIAAGKYIVKIKMDGLLPQQILGFSTVTPGQQVTIPLTSLILGDINNDNQVDILDYNILLSCYGVKQTTASCTMPPTQQTTGADINDDGKIDPIDYNLFLRELSVQKGI